MVRDGSAGSTQAISRSVRRRGGLGFLTLAIAGAAIGWSASQAGAATTYTFNSVTAGTYDWSSGLNWTAAGTANADNFPGGDPAIVDDVATISFNGAGPTGAIVINLSNPLPAANLGGMTFSLMSGTTTDMMTLNLNATLSVTGDVAAIGGASSGNKNGKVNLNVAAGTTLTVGGTLSTSGSDGNGAAGIAINGNLTSATTQLRDDGDNFTAGINAGIVNLGNFTLLRSASSSISTSSPGLHLNGGAVSATGFTIGSGNSSGVAVVAGANLTISGSFIVGDPQSGTANTSRTNTLFQTSGTVTATASSGLSLGAATLATGTTAIASAGTYNLSGGTLNIPMLQMTGSGAASPSTNKATFILSGGATLNIGSGGIVRGTGATFFSSTGGTIAATSSWTNAYTGTIALDTGATTFQAGDSVGNPFDMAFTGAISGGGNLTKTGAGSLSLSGSSSYSGGTTINNGTLYVNNPSNSGTGSGSVRVVSGTLGGHGIISGIGGVDVGTGAHVAPGVNNVGTLTIGTLTLEVGSSADFDFNAAANSMVTITSALALNGGGINLYQEGTTTPFTENGTYTLFNLTAKATLPDNYNSLQILNAQANANYTVGATATSITVTISRVVGGTSEWTVDSDGSWGMASNWTNNVIPEAGVAGFGTAITSPHSVTLDGNRSVTGVVFNNTHAYTIAPGTAGATLTLDNGPANATLSDISGSHSLTATLILNSPTTITITHLADSLTLSGGISGSANLTLTGFGTLLLNGSSTLTGTTTLASGTLGGIGITSGSITPGAAPHAINPGALASVGTLTLGGLTTNPNTTLAFDLTSPAGLNDLLAVTGTVNLGGGTLTVASQVTTTAASLGYYKVLSYGTLTGSITDILLPAVANNIAYTLDTTQDSGFIDIHRGYIGDANDDGKVDLSDLNVVLNNLGTANTSWTKGNFDGAASIDLTDLNDVLNNLGTSIASGSTVVATAAAPEPASLGLLALGAAALVTRRRKA